MRRRFTAALLALLLIGAAGCSASDVTDGTMSPPATSEPAKALVVDDVAVSSVDTEADVPLRLAPGWRIRREWADGVAVVGRSGELTVRRREEPAPDYRERLAKVAASLADTWDTSGPIDTTLFGKPAASVTVVGDGLEGKGYVRLYVDSAEWRVTAERMTGRFDREWASEVARILGDDSTFPLPDR